MDSGFVGLCRPFRGVLDNATTLAGVCRFSFHLDAESMMEGLLVALVHACEALKEIVARYMLSTLFIPLTGYPIDCLFKA